MNFHGSEKVIPQCIGIIMDGNRRWARERGLPALEGHRQGYECLLRCRSLAREKGIRHVIVYAFSTENWRRSSEEIHYLIQLLRTVLITEVRRLQKEGTRIVFIGERARFPEDVQRLMKEVEEKSAANTDVTLVVAVSYGGRAEILDASRRACAAHADVTEETFAKYVWTAGIPDPELIIRTGGARRLSNFLLWQAAYAELYFTDILWPDFDRAEFEKALSFFMETKRNFGA